MKIKNMKIIIQHNTKQWYCNAFSGPKLENKKWSLGEHNIFLLLEMYGNVWKDGR